MKENKKPNALINEHSPYLQQHAYNPVDWQPWSEDLLQKAVQLDKPILVSIGYSTCHWCHVMERESFEDETTAAFMNQYFINVKIDREERPDLDHIYMEAVQAISGSGGWPLNCFLTPDGRPFFGGTYFPPEAAYNRPSWRQVLQHIADAFHAKRAVVEEQADKLLKIIAGSHQHFLKDELKIKDIYKDHLFNAVTVQNTYFTLEKHFDEKYGGFGAAPKFPQTASLQFLFHYFYETKHEKALQHALFSLDCMSRGGIYDHLGGGFARYATDDAWFAPHFEKMLYDNALLIPLYVNAFKITKQRHYRKVIEETLEFILREMTSPEGGFYAAYDADSEGEEGKYYVWQKWEIDQLLGDDSSLFCAFYHVTEEGNWEEKNILFTNQNEEDFAQKIGFSARELELILKQCKHKLLIARQKRIKPSLDNKILLEWNALQCTAFCKAYTAWNEEKYRLAALKNINFLCENFYKNDKLYHSYQAGETKQIAFLDDFANFIAALLNVYEITYNESYIVLAQTLTEQCLAQFYDAEENLFFFTGAQQQDVILRKKSLYDSATPSGNSQMLHNLRRLAVICDEEKYKHIAQKMLSKMLTSIERYPTSFANWALALMSEVYPPLEIAVLGEKAFQYALEIQSQFLPNIIIMASMKKNHIFPLLNRANPSNDTYIYRCQQYQCQLPVTKVADLRAHLQH